ncbi:MAG: hypothetical protein AAF531_01075, partial [Actinomycetota bacterium]
MASKSRHLVVDGSNIATESRTLPSLAQLDEAVRAVQAEEPDRQITVIVDATFAHRIDASERKAFEDANNAGEIVMPPAGAVGRGDAFILQVAEKADAAVLSNDSFQEFHGEHPWLFDEGRLIGGKPVEGIGWVFVPRVPVRGPASRRATKQARDAKKSGKSGSTAKRQSSKRAQGPAPKPSADNPPPSRRDRRGSDGGDRRRQQRRKPGDEESPATDTKAKKSGGKSKGKKSDGKQSATRGGAAKSNRSSKDDGGNRSKSKGAVQELNSPRDFMLFVTQHSIGDEVTGIVDRFSSHGCYLRASSAQCYLPSSAMGDPPPTRARDVVALGQTVIVRVESLDSDRRGINVVLVRTVSDDGNKQKPVAGGKSRGRKARRTSQRLRPVADEAAREENLTRSKTTVATKKTAKKAAKKSPAKKAAKKATKKRAAKATSSARATKAAARKAAKKSPAKKATKKAAKKAPAKKAAKKTTKKAAKKAPAKKAA